MNRSIRLRQRSIRHGMIAGAGGMCAAAAVTWMCAALLYGSSVWAVAALCVAALAAFVAWVEGTEAARLYQLSTEERLYELRRAGSIEV